MADAPQLHDALLVPELAEVYLLLDNVSAVANKTLPDLDRDPVFARSGGSWIEQVCAIRWPPDPGAAQDESLNAARLLRAKDALNRAAWPATGASIAFTLMLAGESTGPRRSRWWDQPLGSEAPTEAEPHFANPRDRLCAGGVFSRVSLAALAYPSLYNGIRRSRRIYRFLNWFLVIALILTCALSWNVATGSSLLNRVDAVVARQTQSVAASERRADRRATPDTPPADASGIGQGEPAATAAREEATAVANTLDEEREARSEAARKELRIPASNLIQWVDDNWWLGWLVGGFRQTSVYYAEEGDGADRPGSGWIIDGFGRISAYDGSAPAEEPMSNLEWAAILIGVLAGTVLPIFYGVLGASAAVVRSIAARLSANTLMPRDLVLALVQLALGAVLGACVGLFVTSDADAAASGPGLLGPVHLSGAALCFLAGFGVEGVFRALESFVAHVFPVGSLSNSVIAPAPTPAAAARPVAMPMPSAPVTPPSPPAEGTGRREES